MTQIYDKTAQREVLAGTGNVFQLFEDKPLNFDAWDIDLFYQEKGTELSSAGIQVIANNPLFTVLEQQVTFGQSTILQKSISMLIRSELILLPRWIGKNASNC